MRKKGKSEEFFGGHVLSILIAVICLVLLVFLGVRLFNIFYNEDEARAEDILNTIEEKIAYFKGDYSEEKLYFNVFRPGDGDWFIVNFQESFFPERDCIGNYENCLCVCKKVKCHDSERIGGVGSLRFQCKSVECSEVRVCKGFEYNIFVKEIHEDPLKSRGEIEDPIEVITEYPETYRLRADVSVQEMEISEKDDTIIIGESTR